METWNRIFLLRSYDYVPFNGHACFGNILFLPIIEVLFLILVSLCRFFERELANETDQFRRILLLEEIRKSKEKEESLMREQRRQMDESNRNLEIALEMLERRQALQAFAKANNIKL